MSDRANSIEKISIGRKHNLYFASFREINAEPQNHARV